MPFQRSTIVLYYNKDAFKEAGLDPEKPPANWEEMQAFAEKLTKRDASGNTTQWGVQIPSSGFPYWLFQGLTTPAGAILMNQAGDRTFYDKPEVTEALQYWVDLSRKHKVHPPGIVEWGTTPKDFFERKVAMMWTTTGNLTNVKANAKFPFGVGMLPAHKRRGSPTGGGNFYISKKASAAEQNAAFQFIKWITTPERAAQWSIDTGYVGGAAGCLRHRRDEEIRGGLPRRRGRARPAQGLGRGIVHAREPACDEGAKRRPAGGADRHQGAGPGDEGRAGRGGADFEAVSVMAPAGAAYSVYLSPVGRGRRTQCAGRGGTGQRRTELPSPARFARDLSPPGRGVRARCTASKPMISRLTATIHGWLLLLPAMAFLALFTHWPALATFIDTFYSTPRPRRPARFVGLDNYATIAADPVFWRALWNNLIVRGSARSPSRSRSRS